MVYTNTYNCQLYGKIVIYGDDAFFPVNTERFKCQDGSHQVSKLNFNSSTQESIETNYREINFFYVPHTSSFIYSIWQRPLYRATYVSASSLYQEINSAGQYTFFPSSDPVSIHNCRYRYRF